MPPSTRLSTSTIVVQPATAGAVPTRASLRSKTVLVIAGNEDERLIWSAVLAHYGYEPVVTDSPAAVPAMASPNLVVVALDRFGPPSASLLRTVRGDPRFSGVPVLGVIDPDVHPSEALHAGCAGVVARPLRPASLEGEVRRLIGPARPPSS